MRPRAYRNYLLVVLTAIVVFNYVDRLALGVLLDDIKADLHLTDTQLGFLGGIAFALFYSVMGLPIARWADRGNRVAIISLTAALWSVTVALCGMAATFSQLLLIRVGVAIGEAGCIPAAFSLIADYFNRAERPHAAAIYGLGGPIACVLGFFLAGWLNQLYGWRETFVLMGSPGLLLTALAWLTLKEPRRAEPELKFAAIARPEPSMKEVAVTLWGNLTFRHLLLSLAVNFFFSYGILQWTPPFLMRSYQLTSGQVGTWLAVIWGLGGVAGSYFGGVWASRYAVNNERLQLIAMALAVAVCGVFQTPVYIAPNLNWAFALLGLSNFALSLTNGPLFAAIQTLVSERMRAVAFALTYLVANLIGMGFGPLTVGVLSDALRPWAEQESLRYALLIVSPGYLWSAWHLLRGSKTVARDLAIVLVAHEGAEVKKDASIKRLPLELCAGGEDCETNIVRKLPPRRTFLRKRS